MQLVEVIRGYSTSDETTEIIMELSKQLGKVPIMAVTAYSASGDEERIRAAGAQAYVSKPISVVRFVAEGRAY